MRNSRVWIAGFGAALALAASSASAFEFPKIFGWGGDKAETPSAGTNRGCPEIQIVGGSPQLRSPPGADAASVRYQIMLGEMARECGVEGDRLSIRVGVQGAAILGPLGQPGSYYGNLRVAVQRQKDETVLGSKVYRVGATIPAGASRAEFQIVADPITVPNDANAAEDYIVIVALQDGPNAEASATKPRGRHRRR